jgi:GH15 family glucan-1,4-alpha-glucosidase
MNPKVGHLDYALIGNCQVSALVDRKGRYVWACMPRFDSPSVFTSLLGGEEAGFWDCLPEDSNYEVRQDYLRNTNIIRTEFLLKSGDKYEILDFAPRFPYRDVHYRAPQFVRVIRALQGNPRVRMRLRPKFDYGRLAPNISLSSNGLVFQNEQHRLFLATDVSSTYLTEEQSFELTGTKYCVLTYGEDFAGSLKFGCEEYLDRTNTYWRNWIKHCNIPFEYQEAVIRSALVLKLHIYEDTGAIIAATTTSIPESPHGGRTWDYRYCWLRDAYFVIHVLNQLGHFEEMENFISFLHNISVGEEGLELQPVYGIAGQRELHESVLPWLKGFNGIGPVRIGNAAYTHDQYDAYGEMVLAATPIFFDSRLDHMDVDRAFENVIHLVERSIAVFDKPDSGLWEFRGEKRHYLFSKIMCWAAVDRGLKIAARMGELDSFPHWQRAAVRMRRGIETQGWNSQLQMYVQAYENPFPDASNLLMAAVKFHTGNDEKFVKTIMAYEKSLVNNGYVFRYKNEDDFGVPRHAFTICTFWMVDALVSMGRVEEARKIFERVLNCANYVGLLSEDVEPGTGQLWGNFPQTYSHVGIINSAFRLSKSWMEAF